MKNFCFNIKKYYKYAVRSAKAELKSEVADSYLNWLWWIIEPICFMLIYTFVFGVIFESREPHFACFVFAGLSFWSFFNRMIVGSVRLISHNRDLVTKVYIPKYILLLSKSFTYLFKLGISLILLFGLMAFYNVYVTLNVLWLMPIIFVIYVVTFGICMILMHFGVFLNDLGNLTNIGLRMLFYLSGIFYDINTRLDGRLAIVLLKFNPIAFTMNEARSVLLYNEGADIVLLLIWFIIGIILCFIGFTIIHKNENSYAKVI